MPSSQDHVEGQFRSLAIANPGQRFDSEITQSSATAPSGSARVEDSHHPQMNLQNYFNLLVNREIRRNVATSRSYFHVVNLTLDNEDREQRFLRQRQISSFTTSEAEQRRRRSQSSLIAGPDFPYARQQCRAQLRIIFSRVPRSVSEDRDTRRDLRMIRTFSMWHSQLYLEESDTSLIAFGIMRLWIGSTTVLTSQPVQSIPLVTWRRTVAASFWVATKLCDRTELLPGAGLMACLANVSRHGLLESELSLLVSLNWRPLAFLSGIPTRRSLERPI